MPNRLQESLALFEIEGDHGIYERLVKLWDEESHTWTEAKRREFQHVHPKAYLSEVPSNPGNHALHRNCSALPTMTFYRLINTVYEGQDWSQRRWFPVLLDIHHDHPELQPYIDAKLQSSYRAQAVRRESSRSVSMCGTQQVGSVREDTVVDTGEGECSGEEQDGEHSFSSLVFQPLSSQPRNDDYQTVAASTTSEKRQTTLPVAFQLRPISEGDSQWKKRKHSTSDALAVEGEGSVETGEDVGDEEGDSVECFVELKLQAAKTEVALEEVFIGLQQVSDEMEVLADAVSKLGGRLDKVEAKEAERSGKVRRSLFGNQ